MQSVTVYIPTNMPKSKMWIDGIGHYMARQFGGVTITRGQGAWLNGFQVLVRDEIALLQSYESQPGQVERYLPGLRELVGNAKIALKQEAMMLTIQEGEMILL